MAVVVATTTAADPAARLVTTMRKKPKGTNNATFASPLGDPRAFGSSRWTSKPDQQSATRGPPRPGTPGGYNVTATITPAERTRPTAAPQGCWRAARHTP